MAPESRAGAQGLAHEARGSRTGARPSSAGAAGGGTRPRGRAPPGSSQSRSGQRNVMTAGSALGSARYAPRAPAWAGRPVVPPLGGGPARRPAVRWSGSAPPAASWRRRLRRSANLEDRLDEVVVRRQLEDVHAGLAKGRAKRRLPPLGGARRSAGGTPGRACPRAAARRSRRPARRRSPRSGSSASSGSTSRTATTSWRCARSPSARRPSGRADEVGDDEDERAAPHELRGRRQEIGQLRDGRTGGGGPEEQPVEDLEHVAAAAPRRDHGNRHAGAAVVEERAHPVAVARQQAGQEGDEVGRHRPLRRAPRAEVHRRRQVEQEPRRDVAILVVLAHVGGAEPRGDVPVDVPDVVVILVLAQVGQVEPGAAEQRPVVALQEPVQAPHHRPLQPPQQLLRMVRRP